MAQQRRQVTEEKGIKSQPQEGTGRGRAPVMGERVSKEPNKQSTKKESEFGICSIWTAPAPDHNHVVRARQFSALSTPGEKEKEEKWPGPT